MKVIFNIAIVLMLGAITVPVLMNKRAQRDWQADLAATQNALVALEEEVYLHSGLGDVDQSPSGFPLEIRAEWFADRPDNKLATGDRPWIDLAPEKDMADQPPDPVITGPDQAAFWYNPQTGVLRARVAKQVTDAETLALYNRVNNADLAEIPYGFDAARTPLAMNPTPTESTAHASPQPSAFEQVIEQVRLENESVQARKRPSDDKEQVKGVQKRRTKRTQAVKG